MALSGRRLGGSPDDLEPDRRRAGERDRLHVGMANQRPAGLAVARQQRQCVGRNPGRVQRLDQPERAARRLLGRLEDNRVAGRQRGARHPGRDREREVPRRDHRGHPPGGVAHPVSLAREPGAAPGPRSRSIAAPRVVLEEVDRLADVGVGLIPRLRALAHLERRELEPVAAEDRRRVEQHLGALARGSARPGGRSGRSPLDRCGDVAGRSRPRRWPRAAMAFPDRSTRSPRSIRRRRRPGPGQSSGRRSSIVPSAASSASRSAARRSSSVGSLANGAVAGRASTLVTVSASSSSSEAPSAWANRNDSFEVFSSSRRTR